MMYSREIEILDKRYILQFESEPSSQKLYETVSRLYLQVFQPTGVLNEKPIEEIPFSILGVMEND